MASPAFGGNATARRGLTADVPGAVGAAVVVRGVVVAGVVDSLGAAGRRTTIRCAEEVVGSTGTWAGTVVIGWVGVGRTKVGDGDGSDVDGGDVGVTVDGGGCVEVGGG